MNRVPVNLGSRSYDVLIGPGLLDQAGSLLGDLTKSQRVFVVTDTHLAETHLESLMRGLGAQAEPINLPPGEATKSWRHLEALCEKLLAAGVERNDVLIAFGGGVIGDLTGFASAILKRGCRFVQIPTTLLAQVDSSVGGKTAINTKAGKNLIGAFHQPMRVLIDPLVLQTLPLRELRAGYAEVVKYGLINDPDFFNWCEQNAAKLLAGDVDAQVYAIEASVKAKAKIVAADERETDDIRALLNLGHTFGHALEAETGFSDQLLHGEAVAIGMVQAHQLSAERGHCPGADADRLTTHLRDLGMPYSIASAGITASGATLVAHMAHDKKKAAGTLPFILSNGIGRAYVDKSVQLDDVARFLDHSGLR